MYFLPYIVDPGCLSKSDLAMRTLYSNLTEVHIYLVEDLMRKYGIHMLTHTVPLDLNFTLASTYSRALTPFHRAVSR